MNAHCTDCNPLVDSLAEQMARKHGPHFDPKKKKALHADLTKWIAKELPRFESDVLHRTLDKAYRLFPFPIDWHRFLCQLLSLLPG